ncbi:MAG: HAMP domain-containing protein [Calditrichaeota bacterium]|nr:HAMP domain-containing protein [Calditrichota bacterium]
MSTIKRPRRSIFIKTFGGYLFMTLVLSSLILFFSFETIRSYYIHTLTRNLKNLGVTYTLDIIPLIKEKRFTTLDSLTKRVGERTNTRITIISPRGLVWADSKKNPQEMENHLMRPEVQTALKGMMGKSLRFSTTVKQEMLYVALPIQKNGQILGIVRESLFLKDINTLLYQIKMRIIIIGFFVTIFALIGAFIFSKSLTRPILQLVRASENVANGHFDVKIHLKNNDELRHLAESFNNMTTQISELFTELSRQKEELTAIVSSLQEGLIVLDPEGKIKLANDSFKRIVRHGKIEGRRFSEILNVQIFSDLIQKARLENRNLVEEIEFNQRVYLVSMTPIPWKNEVILILHDITNRKRLEKLKREFVENVSHELKTPLTAIKGFVETLDQNISGENKHYLDIISKHTDRLIFLVHDLLLLSELEQREPHLAIETIHLADLVRNVVRIFEQKAEKKGLYLDLHVEENLPDISADPYKLEEMLINLIDNAIKYTEKGGVKVGVVRHKQNAVEFRVEDTGIGMKTKYTDRIFERFYRIDKSRSRRMGGTGLGLSIVKHIVMIHKGEIRVETEQGRGTRFRIFIPI